MSHNGGAYYPSPTSGPGWQQPGDSGPLQNQRPQFTPQNRNPPYLHRNPGPPSFGTQNQGPAQPPQNPGTSYPTLNQSSLFPPQNQGPPFPPQNQGPFCPTQNQGASFPSQTQGPTIPPMKQVPLLPPQNQGPLYPPQNQGPHVLPQNQGPAFPPQNQCPRFPHQNQGPSFPPQNQGPLFPAQNQNPCTSQNQGNFFPQNQGPQFPPQNQGPQFPPQNQGSQFPPQNLGPHFSPQNQGTPFSAQNQCPMGPPQNQGPQFAPQSQGALIHQQNQIALCPPQNQAQVFPPQNQGTLYPQNQGPPGPPQNQGPSGLSIPSQNQSQPFLCQNQGPLCPPQNQRLVFHPQNRGPRFPLQNQDPQIPENNGSPYTPLNQGPPYPHSQGRVPHSDQQNDNWESLHAYPEDEECCDSQYGNYGDDWRNQHDYYEDECSNQNYNYEDDRNRTPNHNKNNAFKHRTPRTCGRRKGFFKKDSIEKEFKKPAFIKRLCIGPTEVPNQSSNNIQVKIVKSSDLDYCNPSDDSKLHTRHLDSSMNESKPSCPLFKQTPSGSSKHCKKQEDVCTKSIQAEFNLKSNKSSTGNRNEQSQKTNPAQYKERDSKHNNTNKESSSSSNVQNGSSQYKLIQKVCTQSINQRNNHDNVGFKSNQDKCNPKSNERAIQNKDKSIQNLNKSQDKEIENRFESTKLDPVLISNYQKDDKQFQVIQNISTESAKLVQKHDNIHPELNDTCTVKADNSVLQCNNEQFTMENKAQAKEAMLKNTKGNSSSNFNQQKSSHSNTLLKSQKTSNVQREKLRRSKRLNPQDTDINTKKRKICDKSLIKEEPHSPSRELSMESNLKSKPEMQIKIKDISLSLDSVKINETKVDQISLSQPKDKFKPNSRINIENANGAKFNLTENLPQLKETNFIPNKIANDSKVNETTNMSQLSNESVVKNSEEHPNQALNIKTEPNDTIIKPNDVKTQDSTNNVLSKEALKNEPIEHIEISSIILVQNNTNLSQMNSISPDIAGNIHSEQLQSSCNESPTDDKLQNGNLQINYHSLNEDSQNSSNLSGDGINLLEANLREFDILDEVGESEDDDDKSIISSEIDSKASDQVEFGVDNDDIDAMLEEGLPANQNGTDEKAPRKLKNKVILEEIGHNHFDSLPEGWIKIMHDSGMPVYLEKETRVCNVTRPYFLGPGSARSHNVPLSAVPCMQYKRALEDKKYEEENQGKQTTNSEKTNVSQPPLMPVISAKIETAEENEAAQSLDPTELQEYCKPVFKFKTISVIPFKSWGDRRKFARMTKDLKKQQKPLLPSGTKLLKFPIHNPDGTISKSKGEWVINPTGKSYVCILHEYVQHALKQHPKYQFKELKNPATPYSATVYIGEMQYGTGMGGSKKYAKLEAAKAALEVLIPDMKEKIGGDSEFGMHSGIAKRSQNFENSIFDQINIEDPRVAEFCAKTTEPPPYAILTTCLQRNGIGLDEVKVEYNMNTKRHKEDEFKITVRNNSVTVLCKNKREGKQKAAQAILKALHPNIEHFGSLLRMYGNHSIKSVKEKKQEEQEITGLQCKAAVNQPNYAILNKLSSGMRKLNLKIKEEQANGIFISHRDRLLPGKSTSDLNKINNF